MAQQSIIYEAFFFYILFHFRYNTVWMLFCTFSHLQKSFTLFIEAFICSICIHLRSFIPLDHFEWLLKPKKRMKAWNCIWCAYSAAVTHRFIRYNFKAIVVVILSHSKENRERNQRIMDEVSLYYFCFSPFYALKILRKRKKNQKFRKKFLLYFFSVFVFQIKMEVCATVNLFMLNLK